MTERPFAILDGDISGTGDCGNSPGPVDSTAQGGADMADNSNPVSILHKHPKKRGFVQVENSTVRDPRLSLKATGLLIYLVSLPQGSPVGSRVISARKPDGRSSIMTAFRELRDLGYVEQKTTRKPDGTFTTVTHVYEVPPGAVSEPGRGYPTPDDPTTVNRATSLTENKTGREEEGSIVCPLCADMLPTFDDYQVHRETCDDDGFTSAADLKVVS